MFREIKMVLGLAGCVLLLGLGCEVDALIPRVLRAIPQADRVQQRELEDSEIIRAKADDKDKQQGVGLRILTRLPFSNFKTTANYIPEGLQQPIKKARPAGLFR